METIISIKQRVGPELVHFCLFLRWRGLLRVILVSNLARDRRFVRVDREVLVRSDRLHDLVDRRWLDHDLQALHEQRYEHVESDPRPQRLVRDSALQDLPAGSRLAAVLRTSLGICDSTGTGVFLKRYLSTYTFSFPTD